jgi:hypothetical protein
MPGRAQKGKAAKGAAKSGKRSLFHELVSGVEAMREHREGRLTLRTHKFAPIALPPMDPQLVRETGEFLKGRDMTSPDSSRK